MAKKTLTVILNPAASSGRAERRAASALARLADGGFEIEVQRTERAGHGVELAAAACAAGVRDIATIGGDGTAFEVLNGIFQARSEPGGVDCRLAILPFGTGNSMVHDLTQGDDAAGAATVVEALLAGRTRAIDCFELTGVDLAGLPVRRFILGNLSLGFPADVVALTSRRFKRLGQMGYSLGVLATLWRYRPIELGLDFADGRGLERRRYAFVVVNNNPTFGGNMLMIPDALVDDGLADVGLIEPVGRWQLLKTFPKIFRGTHTDHWAVSFRLTDELTIDTDGPVDVLFDGEIEHFAPKKLEVHRRALEIYA
jgi:diacylglycerol kinase (ATP)